MKLKDFSLYTRALLYFHYVKEQYAQEWPQFFTATIQEWKHLLKEEKSTYLKKLFLLSLLVAVRDTLMCVWKYYKTNYHLLKGYKLI